MERAIGDGTENKIPWDELNGGRVFVSELPQIQAPEVVDQSRARLEKYLASKPERMNTVTDRLVRAPARTRDVLVEKRPRANINTKREIAETVTLAASLSGFAGGFAIGIPLSLINHEVAFPGMVAGFSIAAAAAGITTLKFEIRRISEAKKLQEVAAELKKLALESEKLKGRDRLLKGVFDWSTQVGLGVVTSGLWRLIPRRYDAAVVGISALVSMGAFYQGWVTEKKRAEIDEQRKEILNGYSKHFPS